MENREGTGYLKIWTTTAGQSLPVRGAAVQIYNEDGELLYALTTGDGGLTQTVALPAPPAADSMQPSGGMQPYAVYNIRITRDGFQTVEGAGVPIFDGITAVQPVALLPVPEGSDGQTLPPPVILYNTPPSSLTMGADLSETATGREGTPLPEEGGESR